MDKELDAGAQKAILKRWMEVPQAIRYGPTWVASTNGHFRYGNYHPAHLLNAEQTKTLCNRPQGNMQPRNGTFDPRVDCRKCRDQAILKFPRKEIPDAISRNPPRTKTERL